MAARFSVNLGLSERKAIACASTVGLGRACAEALLAEGVRVVVNGCETARTDAAAHELLARWPDMLDGGASDVTTPAGLRRICSQPSTTVRQAFWCSTSIPRTRRHNRHPDSALVKLLVLARRWWARLATAEIDIATLARAEGVNDSWVSWVVRLNFLAPQIVDAILAGTQPATLNATRGHRNGCILNSVR